MFQWSKKEVKSVTFNPGVADESLLALVESHLEKNPNQSFSDLCKDALWQALCVPESVRPATKTTPPPTPSPNSGVSEPQFADLHRQVADLEERFLLRESNRLDVMERQLMQLSQQLAQLAITVTQGITVQVASTQSGSTGDVFITPSPPAPAIAPVVAPVEVDPVISRLSLLVDDF